MTLPELVNWIAALPLGAFFRRISWIIPLMQTLHILAVAMIMSSVVMIDLRLWRRAGSHTVQESRRRFVPWIWVGMAVLTVSGIVLITIAPRRMLLDPAFQAKMILMTIAIAMTLLVQFAVRPDGHSRFRGAGVLGGAALVVWLCVTFAGRGRWIPGVLPW